MYADTRMDRRSADSNHLNAGGHNRNFVHVYVVRLLWKKLIQPNSDQLSRMLCKGEKEDPGKV